MYIVFAIAIVAGTIMGLIDMPKGRKGAHLQRLQDNEISYGEAFKNLKVVNAWEDDIYKKNTINKKT